MSSSANENQILPDNANPISKKTVVKCPHCDVHFSVFKRKYHCGQCGHVYCSSCTSTRLQIPKYNQSRPMRVCNVCLIADCVVLNDRMTLEKQTPKELKRFANDRHVDVAGCLEKKEILDRIFAVLVTPSNYPLSPTSYSMTNDELPSLPGSPDLPLGDKEKNKAPKIEELSVGSLKTILGNNGIDYSDCLEKQELIRKVERFCPQVFGATTKSELFNIPESEQCIICYDRRIDVCLLECGHLACCAQCSKNLADCPICRRLISRVVHIYHVNR